MINRINREIDPAVEVESPLTLPKRVAAGVVGFFVGLGTFIFMLFRPLLSINRVIQNIKTFVGNVINTIPFLRRLRPPEPQPAQNPSQHIAQIVLAQQIRLSPFIERVILSIREEQIRPVERLFISVNAQQLWPLLNLNREENERQLNQALAVSFFENQERIQRQQGITNEKCQKIIERIQPLQGNIPKFLSEDEIKKYEQFIKDTPQQENAAKELKFYLKVIEDMRCPITQFQLYEMDEKDIPITVVLGKNHQLYNKEALLTYVKTGKHLDTTNRADLSSIEIYGGYPKTFWEGNNKIDFNIENFVYKVRTKIALITSAERRQRKSSNPLPESTSLKTQSFFASNDAKKSNPATAALIACAERRQRKR